MTEMAALVVKGELDLASFVQPEALNAQSNTAAAQAFSEGKCLVVTHAEAS